MAEESGTRGHRFKGQLLPHRFGGYTELSEKVVEAGSKMFKAHLGRSMDRKVLWPKWRQI